MVKRLLIGMVAVAALAISAPVWAQPASTATPGAPPTASAPHTGSATRAHHRRHAVHSAKHQSTGGSADQLNRDELTRSQTGNPSSMNRMPAGGKPTSGTTTQ